MVSVCMITYEHEKFISQTINSVLNQETSFFIELVIVNDSSPDSTDIIIQDIIKSHNKGYLIKYYRHTKNIGMISNFAFALNKCGGKYIAICDGDDYWFDTNKLQKQTDFLENNQDFILVGHNAKLNRNNIEEDNLVRAMETNYVDILPVDMIQKSPFVASMAMFRNIGFSDVLELFQNFIVGDRPLFTMLSFKGKCRFYSEPLGFYRIRSKSVTGKNRTKYISFRNELINRIRHVEFWNSYSNNIYFEKMQLERTRRARQLCNLALRNTDLITAVKFCEYVEGRELKKLTSKFALWLLKLIRKIGIIKRNECTNNLIWPNVKFF